MNIAYWIVSPDFLSRLSHIAQDFLSRHGTAHRRLAFLQLVIKKMPTSQSDRGNSSIKISIKIKSN